MDLCVTVLASLRGRHLYDLARATCNRVKIRVHSTPVGRITLDDDVPVLTKGRALHGERRGGPGVGLEYTKGAKN